MDDEVLLDDDNRELQIGEPVGIVCKTKSEGECGEEQITGV